MLVGLGRGEHHDEKRKQQGDEVRIGDEPPLVICVFGRFLAVCTHDSAGLWAILALGLGGSRLRRVTLIIGALLGHIGCSRGKLKGARSGEGEYSFRGNRSASLTAKLTSVDGRRPP